MSQRVHKGSQPGGQVPGLVCFLCKTITGATDLDKSFNPQAVLASKTWNAGRNDLKKLRAACPFEILEPIQHEHPLDL